MRADPAAPIDDLDHLVERKFPLVFPREVGQAGRVDIEVACHRAIAARAFAMTGRTAIHVFKPPGVVIIVLRDGGRDSQHCGQKAKGDVASGFWAVLGHVDLLIAGMERMGQLGLAPACPH